VSDEKDTAERAKELLVYGPLGLALFLRDSAPQFLRMFVARGRNEVEHRRKSVGDQLDQVRAAGESAAADGGPEMLRLVSNGLASLRERAEEALGALGVLTAEESAATTTPTATHAATVGRPAAGAETASLAIPDYDDLSASQVVDRLEGMPGDELEAIRSYEGAHRARNTILGKIEQLTRGS
jgi:hypothetical protein